jgi:Family of unknown function (DUF6152)
VKSKLSIILGLVVGLLAASAALSAGQAKPDYDSAKQLKLSATVTRFDLSGTHMQLSFDAPDEKGVVQHWTCEADNINTDYRFVYGNDEGWDKLTFRPGDKITITFSPSKKGTKGIGLFLRAELPGDNTVFRVQKPQK